MKAAERLLRYVTVATDSTEGSTSAPTSERQWDLARLLQEEMVQLGIQNVRLQDGCYVYGELPATPGLEKVEPLGLLAHMDTAPAFCGIGVKPQVMKQYDGGPVKLAGSGAVLSPANFPELSTMAGKTLITTDGTTLLGADDKAGIAEIMTLAEKLLTQNTPHGKICIAFTPDEEVGRGAHGFDIEGFGAKIAYTVDGGPAGELEYETFNAASAEVTIHGVSVHPGTAKGVMKNALLLGMEFASLLPAETPANTEGYEGFYHLDRMSGNVAQAELFYIVRDHDSAVFETRKRMVQRAAAWMNEKYGEGTVTLRLSDTYYNMAEKIRPCFYLVERARRAIETVGLVPVVQPVRGGTDGSILSYRGLPCPNLGTGGYAFHGPSEHITAEDMDTCVAILQQLVAEFAHPAE